LIDELGQFGAHTAAVLAHILIRPTSLLSVWCLSTSLILALVWLSVTRKRIIQPIRLLRALFPKNLVFSRSSRADWAMLALGYLVFPSLFAAMTFALPMISSATETGLKALFGAPNQLSAPPLVARIATTIIAFLAFEFAYFIDHWLKHKVPLLWHFHKVHHSAETLSPLTVFRVHPVDSIIYANIGALCTGSAIGVSIWLFGPNASPYKVYGMNVFLLAGFYLLVNLQHTHLWIPFYGWLGKTFLSPAHHQLHHSSDPKHFNSNYGNIIALWDVLFKTHRVPVKSNPRLSFGVAGLNYDPHSATGLLLMPFADSVKSGQQVPTPARATLKTGVQVQPNS
jgi:sterol desaturase/sphingolipid hydroxylase (fatty acid hydroxylase superfamily)